MREFTVDLSKTLLKGLSPIEDREGAVLALHECFNFVPDEAGLKPWTPLASTGHQGAFYNYLTIRDQTGTIFYWYPVFDGHILAGREVPSEPNLVPVPIISTPVEWVEILDENGEVWKLYPDPVDGFTRATDSTMLSGVGISNMVWRGTTLEFWTNKFRTTDHTRFAQKIKV